MLFIEEAKGHLCLHTQPPQLEPHSRKKMKMSKLLGYTINVKQEENLHLKFLPTGGKMGLGEGDEGRCTILTLKGKIKA